MPILYVNNTPLKSIYICSPSLIEIKTNSSNQFSLKWKLNGVEILGQNQGSLFTDKTGKFTAIRTYPNGSEIESNALEIILSASVPNIKINAFKTIFCEGEIALLSVKDNVGLGPSWYQDGISIGKIDSLIATKSGSYKLVYGGDYGCGIVEDQVYLKFDPNPPNPSPNNLQFYTCSDKKFDLIVPGNNNYNYEWFINDTSISNSNILSTSSFGIYQVRISDNNTNCSTLSNYFILSEDPNCMSSGIFLPDVVTQNEDGINDVLSIKNIENFTEYAVEIYNRWGALLTKQTSLEINNSLENIKFDYGQYLILVKNIFTSEIVMFKHFMVVK
jgi:gliding motility-associated-like protein